VAEAGEDRRIPLLTLGAMRNEVESIGFLSKLFRRSSIGEEEELSREFSVASISSGKMDTWLC